jgi:hypothetical protein
LLSLKRIALISAVMLVTAPANATILASVSLPIPQAAVFGCCRVEQDFSLDYNLLVTGASGTGYALLNLTLQGATNQTPYPAPWNFEGDTQMSVAGVGTWWVPYGNWSPFTYVFVPFTFGVPETLHFTGFARAVLVATPGADLSPLAGGPITASVDFSGIRMIYGDDLIHTMPTAAVSLTQMSVPEPSFTCALLLIFLTMAAGRWHRL